ncbi:hypothetical protein [Streptomyces lasiicapitis]|uniref:hypothetical protein n=1 Tax=Streptomyces lasiicapitis TaxID=1923961 RepID=UPI003663D818
MSSRTAARVGPTGGRTTQHTMTTPETTMTEQPEPFPNRRAYVHNAITDGLSKSGDWVPLSVRVAATHAALAEVDAWHAAGEHPAAQSAPASETARLRAAVGSGRRLALTFEVSGNEAIADQIRTALDLDEPAAPPVPAGRAAALTEAERTMLTYALDQAQEHIWSREGFTDEDQAAVNSLRRMADEAQQAGHVYLSTGCHHGDTVLPDGRTGHGYCQTEAQRYDGTTKIAGTCKVCGARCICPCHTSQEQPAVEAEHPSEPS